MTAETYGLVCCSPALVPKSELLHSSEAHHRSILELSHHEWKNRENRFCLVAYELSSLIGKCFLGFASDDVFSCNATSDDVRAWAGACSQAQSHDISTEARRAKDIGRGFFQVFVHNRSFN